MRWACFRFNCLSNRPLSKYIAQYLTKFHCPGNNCDCDCCYDDEQVNGEKTGQNVVQLANYSSYVMYPPLFLAGPVMTYNAFSAQQDHVPVTVSKVSVAISPHSLPACHSPCCRLVMNDPKDHSVQTLR
jgi:hypothetical protein